MRRDPQLKTILSTDSQNIAIDKINANFLGIHYLSGGNLGNRGLTGPAGALGLPGDPGNIGNTGIRGNRWFIGDYQPSGGIGDAILPNDYWINMSTDIINKFSISGWNETSYEITPISEFSKFDNIIGASGAGANAIYYKKTPETSTFNFSDVTLNNTNANPLHSMFMLSSDVETDTGGFALLEFSRGELADGTPTEYLKHPIINFTNASGDNSDVLLLVPRDKLEINSINTDVNGPSYNIELDIAGSLDIRTSDGFVLESTIGAENGFYINSVGTLSINCDGAFKPTFKNFEFDSDPNRINRIKINSIFNIDSQNTTLPGIKITSKVDTVPIGTGNLSVELADGNYIDGTDGYRPDNYQLKIDTIVSTSTKHRFSINSAGSIYRQKENNTFTIISESTNNISYDGSTYRAWYNLGNEDMLISNIKTAFGNDKNEILIDPIGVPDNYTLSIGLQFNTAGTVSYLRNLKNIGETLKLRVRSINSSIKIGSVGITYVSAATGSTNYKYPYTQVHKFNTPSSVIDFTIVKQVSGHTNVGDYVYYDGSGESGFWITTN